jgi:hypothetical protein
MCDAGAGSGFEALKIVLIKWCWVGDETVM